MRGVTYDDYCARVAAVVDYIHEHLDDHLDVASLATRGFLSPFHFQRVFCQVAGENCVRLVRRLRLERAAWQLQNTDLSVSEIAFQAKFESPEAFARSFRRSFGSKATDFREAQWVSYWLLTANGTHYTPADAPTFFPLSKRGQCFPYSVEYVDPFKVTGRLHAGAPHLIGKTCLAFGAEMREMGIDVRRQPIVTYAPVLGPATSLEEAKCFVAVTGEVSDLCNSTIATLGGGLHLRARHVGTGPRLGDFWLRMWQEALPHSGYVQREGPCYQVIQMGLYADEPAALLAEVFIPLEGE